MLQTKTTWYLQGIIKQYIKQKVESKKMITNKNINLEENTPAMKELFGSQHNKNMQTRHTRCVAIINYFDRL